MNNKNKRMFSDEEKKAAQKIVEGRKIELDHLELMVEYNNFMLDKMLYSNYLEKRRGFKTQTDEYENEIMELKNIIKITNKQIEEGVDVLEDIEDECVEELPSMVE